MAQTVPVIYAAVVSALLGLAALVFLRGRRSPANRLFAVTCLALSVWIASLFYMLRLPEVPFLTAVGRLNFAAVLAAVAPAFLFTCALARVQLGRNAVFAVTAESAVLTLITLATPLVDRAEAVRVGVHVTETGPLLPLFALHVVGYPLAAGYLAYRRRSALTARVRSQLALVGAGIVATAAVNAVTGLLLPYGYGIFAYEEAGALAVAAFASCVGWAILTKRLFDVRIAIRRAVLYAVMFALIEKAYSALVDGAARAVAGDSEVTRHLLSAGAVALIAATYSPFRRWLEPLLDRLLFPRSRRRQASRTGT